MDAFDAILEDPLRGTRLGYVHPRKNQVPPLLSIRPSSSFISPSSISNNFNSTFPTYFHLQEIVLSYRYIILCICTADCNILASTSRIHTPHTMARTSLGKRTRNVVDEGTAITPFPWGNCTPIATQLLTHTPQTPSWRLPGNERGNRPPLPRAKRTKILSRLPMTPASRPPASRPPTSRQSDPHGRGQPRPP